MKKFATLAVLLLAASCFADEITFNFHLGSLHSVDASLSGVLLGPALNFSVSDRTTGVAFPLDGVFASSTGAASSFVVLTSPNVVLAGFNAGGPGSVLITDTMGNPLVAGTMQDNGSILSAYPNGQGAFLGTFDVQFVDPAVLALFGLHHAFNPEGSVSATFGQANILGIDHLGANIGGGSVTILTPTPVPEPEELGLAGCFLLGGFAVVRRRAEG